MRQDTKILNGLTPPGTQAELTLLPAASLANHTAAQESGLGKKMSATCGPKCLESFGRFPRVGLWAKTFAALLLGRTDWYSTRCKLTWRLRGTKYRRLFFLLQVSTRRTKDTEHGLLPTPVVSTSTYQYSNGDKARPKTLTLYGVAKAGLLPTPNAADNRDRGGPSTPAVARRMEKGKQVGLTMLVDGQLNPRFVAEMMGFPPDWLELPFQSTVRKA